MRMGGPKPWRIWISPSTASSAAMVISQVPASSQPTTGCDGVTPVFTTATCWSLLVYYVLAMQCLPTLAVTAREAGGARWALIQLGWMTLLAYVGALVAFHLAA